MTHEQVSKLMARFEAAHPVETYVVEGVHVWPVIRMYFGIRLLALHGGLEPRPAPVLDAGRIAGALRSRALRVFRALRNRYRFAAARFPEGLRRRNQWPQSPQGFQAAVITVSDRCIRWGDSWLHTVVDPLADLLEERGLKTCIWELGRSPQPRRRQPVHARELHKHEYNRVSQTLPFALPRPGWFDEIEEYFEQEHGVRIRWTEHEAIVRHILVLARVYEAWMESAGCRIVFFDCWFTALSLAAALAAHRLGIPCVDFQHGLIGRENLAYTSWTRAPREGYEVMPDLFWMWGAHEAEAALHNNAAGVIEAGKILVGGSAWINRWREGRDAEMERSCASAAALCKGFSRSILLTLQTPFSAFPDWLPEAIRRSPHDWRWLVRVHRRHPGGPQAHDREFLSLGHPGVEIREATALPLYALLRQVQVHVTGYSTCALEALAFGVPSLLTHPSGDGLYREFLESGVMKRCSSAEDVLDALKGGFRVSPAEMERAAGQAFAPPSEAARAMDALLGRAGLA